jgi:RNA polymerase sigma-70 factor, ECF subfamily
MDYEQLELLLFDIASSYQWGLKDEGLASAQEQITFLISLKVEDLVLARACAAGNEKAWDAFLAGYRELLYRAAYAIAKQDALGRELADSLYAELFGTTTRDGVRLSKLASYTGRGSLAGWLRSVLSQRFIDDYRKTRRTVSLEEQESELLAALPGPDAVAALEGVPLRKISESIGRVLKSMKAEESLLLQSYYLDQRSMAEIGRLFRVHESTISRKLNQVAKELKKRVLKQLQSDGFSLKVAEEVFSTDVRDLDIDVRKFLQAARETPFQKIGPAVEEKH